MPQKHDPGWKKRDAGDNKEDKPDTDELAKRLVRRGLASAAILDANRGGLR